MAERERAGVAEDGRKPEVVNVFFLGGVVARLKDGEFPLIMEVIICWEIFRHCQNPPKKQYNTIHSRGLLPLLTMHADVCA